MWLELETKKRELEAIIEYRTKGAILRGCPCKNRPLDSRPKTEFLQIFRVRQLVHMINKNGNNLAFNTIFSIFLATISEDGTKPFKSFCFESNLGIALKALKNYSITQIQ